MLYKIRSALRLLGIKGWQTAYAVARTAFTTDVYANGKYIGLWDTVKNTFVE